MRSVEYPEGWFYVERASVLAFWLVGTIDPEVDAMRVGYPYIMPLLQSHLSKGGAMAMFGGEAEPTEGAAASEAPASTEGEPGPVDAAAAEA